MIPVSDFLDQVVDRPLTIRAEASAPIANAATEVLFDGRPAPCDVSLEDNGWSRVYRCGVPRDVARIEFRTAHVAEPVDPLVPVFLLHVEYKDLQCTTQSRVCPA